MGSCKFAIKTLLSNSKSSICYLCSMVFPIAVIFNLLNISCNTEFISKNLDGKSLCAGIIFTLSIFIYVFTFYSNSHFVISTSKELAVASLSGIHPNKLGRILLFSLKSTASLMLITAFFIDFMLSFAVSASNTQLKVISIFSYVILLILISSSIVYKFIMEIPAKVHTFKQLSLIGYTKPQLNTIINKEVFLFYSIVTLVPLIHICTFLVGLSSFNTLLISLICIFLVAFLISGFISFILYKKSIFKSDDIGFNKFAH